MAGNIVKISTVDNKKIKYELDAHERSPGERWITMSNALTRAGHGLSLAEKRIVMMAVSKLDSARRFNENEPLKTKIFAAEYARECDISMNTAYEQLQYAAKNIYSRSITFYEQAHRRNGTAIELTRSNMRWVGQIKYHDGEGWVELHWWPPLIKHLMGLKKQFTSYQLQQASALRSIYSWRLLELLTRFESTGWAEYSIDDFAISMDASEKQKDDFANIRRRIIEPAVKELGEKDGWLIKWKPIKAGRKVKAIRFDFMRDPQTRLF